jgi:hypothetical protein
MVLPTTDASFLDEIRVKLEDTFVSTEAFTEALARLTRVESPSSKIDAKVVPLRFYGIETMLISVNDTPRYVEIHNTLAVALLR